MEPQASKPVDAIVPRPGESVTAAIIRVMDPDSGSGLSWLDKIALKERERQKEQSSHDPRDQ